MMNTDSVGFPAKISVISDPAHTERDPAQGATRRILS
jgi:hypothetical protein